MNSVDHRGIRAAVYARGSSERQAQEGTIDSQVQALQERVGAEGRALDEGLCFVDEGYSGSTLVRPALERLRDQATAGAIDRLYVHSPDRLARRYAYQVLLVDELQHCGVELVFLNRPLGQGPEDDLLLQVQGVVAEYERAKILERSRRGKLHAARRGNVSVLSQAPYGYRYVSRELAGGEARFDVCLPEARGVRDVYRGVAEERVSISQAARRLGEQGILSPRGRSCWDRSTVWGMLRNPAYQGAAGFGKRRIGSRLPRHRPQRNGREQPRRPVSGCRTSPEQWTPIPVPAIIEESLFDAVQEQLKDNKQRHRLAGRGARYLLQGLVVCQYLEKLQAEAQTQEQLQAEIREMRLVIGHLEAFAERVRGGLDNADWTTQRQLVSTLVKRVEVGEEEVRVVYRVDCGPFEGAPSGGPWQDCWRRREPTRAPTQGPKPNGGRGILGRAPPVLPIPFGIGIKAVNPSRQQPPASEHQGGQNLRKHVVKLSGTRSVQRPPRCAYPLSDDFARRRL